MTTTHSRIPVGPPPRSRLLEEAMNKPVKPYRQFDALGLEDDDFWYGGTWELRNGGAIVRVQIDADVTPDDALAMLEGIVRTIKSAVEEYDSWDDIDPRFTTPPPF